MITLSRFYRCLGLPKVFHFLKFLGQKEKTILQCASLNRRHSCKRERITAEECETVCMPTASSTLLQRRGQSNATAQPPLSSRVLTQPQYSSFYLQSDQHTHYRATSDFINEIASVKQVSSFDTERYARN